MGTSDPLDTGWYHSSSGAAPDPSQGPLTWQELVARARAGALRADDLVWHPTFFGWLPASQVPGLLLGPSAPYTAPPAASRPASRSWLSRYGWVLPLAALVLVGILVALILALRSPGEEDASGSTPSGGGTTGPAATAPPSSAPPVTAPPAAPDTWLVMLYTAADDEVLEEDLLYDLNEAELVGSSDQVTIVAQVDRFAGGFAGDGDVTSTKRYLITQDNDLFALRSTELADLGEQDMGSPDTLRDFATWAITTYPAAKHALVLSDHGRGWIGGWTDDDPVPGSGLTLHEIDVALGEVVAETGIGALELVGFDACLMSQLEVMSALAPHARYCVASEELEPAIGWGYSGFLKELTASPTMSGRELGQAIVNSYVTQDVRITDDEARRRLTGGDYPARKVAEVLSLETTLAAIDLAAIQALDGALNELAVALGASDQRTVARARTYAQAFASVFGKEHPPSFLDLGHFVELLAANLDDPAVQSAVSKVQAALARAVVAEIHGEGRPGATGLSIYFPNSQEYEAAFGSEKLNYPLSAGRFATAALWDDYLTYHYTGRPFDPASADLSVVTPPQSNLRDFAEAATRSTPPQGTSIEAPGAGALSIAPLDLSAITVAVDETVSLSTTVTGTNIAYVYYYVSYFWEEDGSYLSADAGFVEPGNVKEVGGLYYPDWDQGGSVEVEFDWEPTLYFMSDGDPAHDQFAFFVPSTYGASRAEDIYTVRGTYTFRDTGTQVEAEIDFSGEGDMLSVWGFFSDGDADTGAWYEITPTAGDTFTITHEYLEFTANPEGEFAYYDGGTMVFGDQPFTMVPYTAFPGDYALGVGVEDFDGNLTWEFAELTVTE